MHVDKPIEVAAGSPSLLPATVRTACFSFAVLVASCGGGGSDAPLDATSANCFDDSTLSLGTKIVANYAVSGPENGTRTETTVVSAINGQFNGVDGLVVKNVGTTGTTLVAIPGSSPFNTSIDGSLTMFEKVQEPGVTALYGTASQGRVSNVTTVYAPAYVDARKRLPVGGSATFIQSGTRTEVTPMLGQTTTTLINSQIRVTFRGVEVLDLPRGPTPACRYSLSTNGAPETNEWLFRSVLVRSEQPSPIFALPSPEVLELQNATVNGTPL